MSYGVIGSSTSMELAASARLGFGGESLCGRKETSFLCEGRKLASPASLRAWCVGGERRPHLHDLRAAAGNGWHRTAKDRLAHGSRVYHRVEEGDTLFSIAKQHNTTMRSIALANDVTNIDVLRAGQVLVVPVLPGGFTRVSAVITDLAEPVVSQAVGFGIGEGGGRGGSAGPVVGVARFAIPAFLLAPILGFCARCLVDRILARAEDLVQARLLEDARWDIYHRNQLREWKGRMGEFKAGELPADSVALALASSSAKGEDGMEERDQDDEVDPYQSYAELESSYTKFLVDSGLAETGYRQPASVRGRDG